MEHVAIMKKEWGLTQKVIDGTKTVESRWYKSKIAPWNKIKTGDFIFFKDSGSPVVVKATVTEVEQYDVMNNQQALNIMTKHALADLGTADIPESVKNYITNKRYAIFIHFNNVEKIVPYDINKKGYGIQCAWMVVDLVDNIKVKSGSRGH